MCQGNNQAFDRVIQTTLNDMPNKAEKLVCEVGCKTYVFLPRFSFHVLIKVLLPSKSIAKGNY